MRKKRLPKKLIVGTVTEAVVECTATAPLPRERVRTETVPGRPDRISPPLRSTSRRSCIASRAMARSARKLSERKRVVVAVGAEVMGRKEELTTTYANLSIDSKREVVLRSYSRDRPLSGSFARASTRVPGTTRFQARDDSSTNNCRVP